VGKERGKKSSIDLQFGRRKILSYLGVAPIGFLVSCRKPRPNPGKITMRPRFVLEENPTSPVLLEFDFVRVDLGTVDNILSSEENDRSYALWFALERRAALTLQTVTAKNIGKNLIFILAGQRMGIHPIDNTISNGILPVLLTSVKTEDNARLLHKELSSSLDTIQYLLQKEQNK